MQTRSAKRARDKERTNWSKRPRLADSEEEEPLVRALSSEKEACERTEPAARGCKRPFRQSKAAGEYRAVSITATLKLEQEVDNTEPENSPAQPEEEQLHPLGKRQKVGAEEGGDSASISHQGVEMVMLEDSPAQSEEEQLHPLSKRRELGPAEQGEATSAVQQEVEAATSEDIITISERRRCPPLRLPVCGERPLMNEYEETIARDLPDDARRMSGSIFEQDSQTRENESKSDEDEAMSEAGQSHSRDDKSDSGEDESDFSDDESDFSDDESGSESGGDEPNVYQRVLDIRLANHAAELPPELSELARSDAFRRTLEQWLFVSSWGPERELMMRYLKALLGLPKDQCWTPENWAEVSKLDSKQLAKELQAPLEQVESELFIRPEDFYTQTPLLLSDADLRFFIAEIASEKDYLNAQLYFGMFRFVFGKSAEELVEPAHSWQDEWQKCQAGIQEYDE